MLLPFKPWGEDKSPPVSRKEDVAYAYKSLATVPSRPRNVDDFQKLGEEVVRPIVRAFLNLTEDEARKKCEGEDSPYYVYSFRRHSDNTDVGFWETVIELRRKDDPCASLEVHAEYFSPQHHTRQDAGIDFSIRVTREEVVPGAYIVGTPFGAPERFWENWNSGGVMYFSDEDLIALGATPADDGEGIISFPPRIIPLRRRQHTWYMQSDPKAGKAKYWEPASYNTSPELGTHPTAVLRYIEGENVEHVNQNRNNVFAKLCKTDLVDISFLID